MDTVSMLNTMRFYCQPILPLVYDESMSYYETLCKVVGQLNTTGEAVNKLNEGLTGEISDRQAADAALDERLKKIEETYQSIHFLVFDGANPNSIMPTRDELYQWVKNGDAIYTLFSTNETGRGQVYAASCTYNAGNWDSEASNDFNIIVPIETSYDSVNDYAVRQKVAKLTIPPISKPSLSVPWDLQIIEINTPFTTAEGVVNFIAAVNDSGAVNASLSPSEFLQLYNATRGSKNLCVAVNAKLAYDGVTRSSAIATVDTTNRIVRVAFERDYGTSITNGVNQLNKTFDYIIGDAKTGAWVHETIDSKIFDFIRYEGFQFTRGAGNVITTDDESTPNAVYAQYNSSTSGRLYQNLPVRLIDTVDGAEYWNGTFDVYGNHMTFTFVTSNYATSSDKMLVRVIELSADVNMTAWKYGVKEFSLPLDASNDVVTYTASKVGEGEYLASKHTVEYQVDFAEGIPAIIASIEAGKRVIFRVDLKEIDSVTGATPVYFASGYTKVSLSSDTHVYLFAGDILNGNYSLQITSGLEHATLIYYGETLPTPNPDGSDSGKVPTVEGTKWALKTQDSGSPDAVLYTAQTLTDEQKKQARENIDVAIADFVVNGTVNSDRTVTLDKTFAQIQEAVQGVKEDHVRLLLTMSGSTFVLPVVVIASDAVAFQAELIGAGSIVQTVNVTVTANGSTIKFNLGISLDSDGSLPQIPMATDPTLPMQIATKKYVDDNKTVVDDALSDSSTNPVQNKVIAAALATVVRETIYPIAVTATSTEWTVNNGIAYKEASTDRTFDNIKAAYNGNKTPVCEFEGMTYSLILTSSTAFVFASYRGAVANDSQYAGLGKYPTSLITINTTGVVISRTAGDLPAVDGADNGKMLIVAGGEWVLQSVAGTTVDKELSTTSENPVQNKTVTAALNDKLPKTGGTVTGALRTNDSFSAGGTIAFGEAPIGLSQTADGAAEIRSGSADVDDNPPPLARLKVAYPAEDDDAATKKYVNSRNESPQFKGYVTLTPANETLGVGVGLSPSRDGNNYALDISDVNEGKPTLLTGVKTPADADTNAAATVEYVLAKAAGGSTPLVLTYANNQVTGASYSDIRKAIEGGRQIKLAVANTLDIIAANTKNETDKSELKFINVDVGGDTISISQYTVTAQASGVTVNAKSSELTPG